ncbi:LanC-like protein [Ideonella sp. 4Y11]|uniref:LanC-like protein n=1 Tax=Ideonella aquatica TaxID=2824119 RepID=A0A941BK84_9BURK|nr:LanC-like protein [Ideonella aquatica]MBQ0958289.1 LanC-like protein [Ideonella aquatica]
MSLIFHPERHTPLDAPAWDADAARATVQEIVSTCEAAARPDGTWPVHPRDDAGDTPDGGFKGLYLGGAGLLWALWWLRRQGHASLPWDPAARVDALAAAWQRAPDNGEPLPSWFLGEAGLRLVQWRLTGRDDAASRLLAVAAANRHHPSQEALWGAPGTMLGAWHLAHLANDPRAVDELRANVSAVMAGLHRHDDSGCQVWTQAIHGREVIYLGAGHGLAGNLHALLLASAWLPEAERAALQALAIDTLSRTARREGALANWPPGLYTPRPGGALALLQWCHGAPGILCAMNALPSNLDAEFEALLAAAGEAIWQAGPLAKGPGVCHGTAGNALALLALHARQGDERWLQRARAFAMHAIGQMRALQHQHGQPWHGLWTGDMGLACVLAQCLVGRYQGVPTLDLA